MKGLIVGGGVAVTVGKGVGVIVGKGVGVDVLCGVGATLEAATLGFGLGVIWRVSGSEQAARMLAKRMTEEIAKIRPCRTRVLQLEP
ncbi:hypothetical protein M1O29_02550 [Dehalococcoidia bacterium]|nr:hypothetical protein [Dehalococcoidia bacterium]